MHPERVLETLSVRPRKRWSQNFLISPHWIEKIVTTVSHLDADEFWEIGPGLGALTEPLSKICASKLRLFEIDPAYCRHLRETYPNVSLEEGDFLKVDLATRLEGKKVSVVSNLPYHISTPIFMRFCDRASSVQILVLMFQKEFADRIRAKQGDESYGALSLISQSYFDVESLGKVPKGAFYPKPDVDSEVLVFRPRSGLNLQRIKHFHAWVRTCFQAPRKTLVNNLKNNFQLAEIHKAFTSLSLNLNVRPEDLDRKQYEALFETLGSLPCTEQLKVGTVAQ